ncbi:MAG: hypothetical protein ABGZ49_09095 [Akkermansiaceae bacterium]
MAAGMKGSELRAYVFNLMEGVVAGGTKHGTAAQKTVTVLTRTWANVDSEVVGLRDRALGLLSSLSPQERVGLHWAMAIAGYRFFGDVASTTGRLLQLQGDLNLAQITRRLREAWGERSTMNRAAQRVVRSMVQWGGLADTDSKGVYTHISKRITIQGELAEVLLEALLIHEGKGIQVDQALCHPALFPFHLKLRGYTLRQSLRFEVHRQGLDVDVVSLATE